MSCRSRAARAIALAMAISASMVGSIAGAEMPGAEARSDALFDAGKASLARGDWTGACAQFEESMRLDASVSTLVKIARCRAHEKKMESARKKYEEALDLNSRLTRDPARRRRLDQTIESELALLLPRIPKLRIEIHPVPKEARLSLDDIVIVADRPVYELRVDPGEHTVVVRAAGFAEERRPFVATEGAVISISIVLRAEPAPVMLSLPAPSGVSEPKLLETSRPAGISKEPRRTVRRSARRTIGWIVSGTGLAAMAAGAVLGVETLTLVASADCDRSHVCTERGASTIHQAERTQTAGFVAGGIGVAALAGGLWLLATAPDVSATDGGDRETVSFSTNGESR